MSIFPLKPYQEAEIETLTLIKEAVISTSSLLGSIATHPTRHNSRNVNLIEPTVIEHGLQEISAEFEIPHDLIRSGDVERYVDILTDAFYDGFVEPLERNFVKVITDVTTAAGNTVDAAQQGLGTFDAILCALESVEMSLDEDNQLVMPTIAANPDTLKNLSKQTLSDAEYQRLNDLLIRKHRGLLNNRKSRRLVDRSAGID